MTSVLNVDEIAAKDGTSPVALTKQDAAKAWVIFDGTGTIAADDSLNLSSLTDSGTGQYAQNFTSSFSATEYSVLADDGHRGVGESGYSTTSKATTVRRQNNSESTVDVSKISMVEHGDLA